MTEIPAEAQRLHQEARAAGGRGDYEAALSLLNQAHQLAPAWAYPLYDAAFTYLLQGNAAQAEQLYRAVDQMEPRGFFTCKTSLDILRREREGSIPAGFSKAFALLEWTPPDEKREILQSLVRQYPDFAPAWAQLFLLLPDLQERLQAIENGLAAQPDQETRGQLLLNKAFVLRQLGRTEEAVEIIRAVAADPKSTLSSAAWAKKLLAG